MVTQSRISRQLFLSRQTLNSAFKQLVKKQLIVLETFEDNQRTKRAVLTAKGSDLAEKLAVRMHQAEKKAWENLEKEEQELLTRLTRKYADALGETLQEMKG